MTVEHPQESASSAPGRWATASPMSARWPAIDVVMLNDIAEPSASRPASPPSTATWRARSPQASITEDERKAALARITPAETTTTTSATCDLVIEAATENEEVKRKIFADALPVAEARRDRRHQHLVDLDHAARRRHRPARALHRHAFHESGAADGAGRADPRHRHRRRDLRAAPRTFVEQARQDDRGVGGFPRLHRQPHPAADDQRGDLHALRGRRHGRGDRHRDAARRQPSDGAAASSPTSSASTPACRSCRCCTRAWPIPNTGPARCW